jgi:tRNA threonylcarbamoyladenosine biosynthesis protein TsaE
MNQRICTVHESGLNAFAHKVAEEWLPRIQTEGLVVSLSGDMGAGKTTFVRALAGYWGLEQEVCSPSYVLQNVYVNDRITVHHWDVYRTTELPLELTQRVLPGELWLIEWAEIYGLFSGEDTTQVRLTFDPSDAESRIVEIWQVTTQLKP